MINKKYLKSLRDKVSNSNNEFIYEQIGTRIADSIDLININFKNILEIGINCSRIYKYLKKKNPKSNILRTDISSTKLQNQNIKETYLMDIDVWNLNKNKYDLIFSNFFIHLTDNFDTLLNNIYNSLKPNGFFIATIPSEKNIYQLKNSFINTDLEIYNGVHQRINPTIDLKTILLLLKKNNFTIPVIEVDSINIKYTKFKNLLNDLRSMNLTYCYTDKLKKFEKKKYFDLLKRKYKEKYYKDKKYIIETEILIITAWKDKPRNLMNQ